MAADTSIQHVPNMYPIDVETYKSRQTLASYRDRLTRENDELFVPEGRQRFVVLWDLLEGENGEQ